MSTTDTPKLTTDHPAKDSGGARIFGVADIPFIRMRLRWLVSGREGNMPIHPDDYARQKEIEVAKPRDNPIGTTLFNQCKPRCWGYGDRYIAWSRLNSPSHLVPPAGDYARHWELEGPR